MKKVLFVLCFVFVEFGGFGQTWHKVPAENTPNIAKISYENIHFFDENNGWVVGSEGTILHTTDAGESWIIQNSSVDVTLRNINFKTPLIGRALGDGVILSTIDGGTTWIKETTGSAIWSQDVNLGGYLNTTFFLNASTGWTAGTGGWSEGYRGLKTKKTIDGGATWTEQANNTVGQYVTFTSIFFINENQGWLVGKPTNQDQNCIIQYTNDGGETWVKQNWPGKYNDPNDERGYNFTGVTFYDENNGFVFYGENECLKTTNGGTTWVKFNIGMTSKKGQFTNTTTGYIVGEGSIMKTSDSGLTWINKAPDLRNTLKSVFHAQQPYVYAVGNGTAIVSKNGGKIWEPIKYNPYYAENEIYDLGGDFQVIAGVKKLYVQSILGYNPNLQFVGGSIFYSANGGTAFTESSFGQVPTYNSNNGNYSPIRMNDIYVGRGLNDGIAGYAVGTNGSIYFGNMATRRNSGYYQMTLQNSGTSAAIYKRCCGR